MNACIVLNCLRIDMLVLCVTIMYEFWNKGCFVVDLLCKPYSENVQRSIQSHKGLSQVCSDRDMARDISARNAIYHRPCDFEALRVSRTRCYPAL